jgi:hypothetical protein
MLKEEKKKKKRKEKREIYPPGVPRPERNQRFLPVLY